MVNHSFIYSCTEMSEKLNFDVESRKGTGIQLAKAGYAVHGIDYQGHGKSEGLQGFVADFDELVDDCFEHFSSICGMYAKSNPRKKGMEFHTFGRSFNLCLFLVLCCDFCREKREQKEDEVSIRGVNGGSCGSPPAQEDTKLLGWSSSGGSNVQGCSFFSSTKI